MFSKAMSFFPVFDCGLLTVVMLMLCPWASGEVVQVRIRKNVMMPARDGIRLATDVYLPDGDKLSLGPFPTILIRTPYNKTRVVETAEFFTTQGYAVAVQDVRGRFASEGEFYIYVNEGMDGYDTVQWLAQQSWCNGDVGTYGGSYLAATQNALAVLRPPPLRTMFVMVGTANYVEDGAGRGGAFALLHNLTYGFRLAYTGKSARQDDPEEGEVETTAGRALRQAYSQLADWLKAAPLKNNSPLRWVPLYAKWYADWRGHPTYDDYWKRNGYNFEEYYAEFPDIPICFIGGWYDIFKRGTLKNFTGLNDGKLYVRLLMGPWTHSTGKTFSGDVDFGPEAKMNMKRKAARWFNQFLKGQDEGIDREPAVQYFLMSRGDTTKNKDGRLQSGGQWKTADRWPPKGFIDQKFYLQADQSLQTSVCRSSPNSHFEFDPHDPVPTIGGNIDSGKHLVRRGAQNQIPIESDFAARNQLPLSARHDVLSFETPPLEQDVEVTGPMRVELWVSSTVKDTDFTAKLIDVHPPSKDYPRGYEMNLEDGILRMRFRNSREREELMRPGTVYKITIELWATANLFRKGSRIRLDISSSNFPLYDINPNIGEPLGKHTKTITALNTIYHNPEHPSCLVLPVRDNEVDR